MGGVEERKAIVRGAVGVDHRGKPTVPNFERLIE